MRERIYTVTERLDLPGQVMGVSEVVVTGGRQVLLVGHKGIRSYGAEETVVDMADCAISVTGRELTITAMTKRELLLRGEITSVGYLK